MKKIFRTFIITLVGVVIAGLIYIVYYKPTFAQSIVGCSPMTDDQKDFNQQLADAIDDLRTNDEMIISTLEKLQSDDNHIDTNNTEEDNNNENPETEEENNITDTTNSNTQLNDVTEIADESNNKEE